VPSTSVVKRRWGACLDTTCEARRKETPTPSISLRQVNLTRRYIGAHPEEALKQVSHPKSKDSSESPGCIDKKSMGYSFVT